MKLSDFLLLNEEQKKTTVLHQGVLVGKRKDDVTISFLFQLNHFYVEACFDVKSRLLREYRMFLSSVLLEQYLDKLELDGLIS